MMNDYAFEMETNTKIYAEGHSMGFLDAANQSRERECPYINEDKAALWRRAYEAGQIEFFQTNEFKEL